MSAKTRDPHLVCFKREHHRALPRELHVCDEIVVVLRPHRTDREICRRYTAASYSAFGRATGTKGVRPSQRQGMGVLVVGRRVRRAQDEIRGARAAEGDGLAALSVPRLGYYLGRWCGAAAGSRLRQQDFPRELARWGEKTRTKKFSGRQVRRLPVRVSIPIATLRPWIKNQSRHKRLRAEQKGQAGRSWRSMEICAPPFLSCAHTC